MKRVLSMLFLLLVGVSGELFAQVNLSFSEQIRRLNQSIASGKSVPVDSLQRVLNLYEQRYTTQSPQYAECVLWVARYYQEGRAYRQSREMIEKSDEIFKRYGDGPFSGRDTLNEIFRLDLISSIENECGRHYMALQYAKKAVHLKKCYFGPESEISLSARLDLSKLYAERLRYRESTKTHTHAYLSYVDMIRNRFCLMSDADREEYWQTAARYINKTISLAHKQGSRQFSTNKELSQSAYDAMLLSKGLLLNVSVGFENFILNHGNEPAKSLLGQKIELLSHNATREELDSIDYAIIDALNEDGIHYTIPHLSITWRDVQNNLNEDDLAVEFYRTPTMDYGAILLRKSWDAPRIVPLKSTITLDGRTVSLNAALADFNLRLQKVDMFDQTFWSYSKAIWSDQIVKYFPKTDKGVVYFSADGLLQVICIEYLPFVKPEDEKSSQISSLYNMCRLSSTRALAMRDAVDAESNSAALFGGLTYRMMKSTMEDQTKEWRKKSKEEECQDQSRDQSQGPSQDQNRGKLRSIKYTQFYAREGSQTEITALENTLYEVEKIDDIIKENKGKSQMFVEEQGVEEAFKALSGGESNILHVATHGFYLSPADLEEMSTPVGEETMKDPLKRTGLLMAGAHRSYIEHNPIQGIDDGVLSAYEISQMDLGRMELAVLSACETGLGDITPDGVAGLQRGFKMAGAKSLLMSLWKVDDKATYQLMTEFYRNWVELKMSKTDALQKAQKSIRENSDSPEWKSPRFWAAFILLDDCNKE